MNYLFILKKLSYVDIAGPGIATPSMKKISNPWAIQARQEKNCAALGSQNISITEVARGRLMTSSQKYLGRNWKNCGEDLSRKARLDSSRKS